MKVNTRKKIYFKQSNFDGMRQMNIHFYFINFISVQLNLWKNKFFRRGKIC